LVRVAYRVRNYCGKTVKKNLFFHIRDPRSAIRNYIVSILFFIVLLNYITANAYTGEPGYHYRFDYWPCRAIRYLGIQYPEAMLRLSELPLSRQNAYMLIEKIGKYKKYKSEDLSGFYFNRLSHLLASVRENRGKKPIFELNLRNQPAYSNSMHPTKKLRLESDLIGYSQIKNGLSTYIDFQFDTDGLHDSDYHGVYEWKNVVADMRAAYFQYTSNRWSLLIGRDFIHWGPGSTGALLTSGYAPSLDMIKLTLDVWKFRFQAFNSFLERGNETEDREKINRYFSGHRLSFRLPLAEFAVNEAVMYGGPREVISATYFNPLIPYYFTDVMQIQNRDDNILLSLEATVYWPRNYRFYGQYLVDEYYYEGENYPKRTALLVGVDWTKAFGWANCWLNLEYVRVDRWTYNYEATSPWNRLNYYNSLLGHPIGPDADLIHVEPEIYLFRNILFRAAFDYSRHGETKIDTPLRLSEHYGETHPHFPFGIVEKTSSLTFQFECAPSASWLANITLQYLSCSNQEHIECNNMSHFAFRVTVQNNLHLVF